MSMEETDWLLVIVAGTVVAVLGRHVYRRWVAAKLAEKLLADVVKGKDSFRR